MNNYEEKIGWSRGIVIGSVHSLRATGQIYRLVAADVKKNEIKLQNGSFFWIGGIEEFNEHFKQEVA